MTGDDFFLLFAAFAGFVAAPTLLLWGLARLIRHNKAGGGDRGGRSDPGPMDEPGDKGRREATRPKKQTEFLHRFHTARSFAWVTKSSPECA